jgi:hypothetical protein
LRQGQLITSVTGDCVELANDVDTPEVVKRLVELGIPVFEVTPTRQTLEEFYLELMNAGRAAKN